MIGMPRIIGKLLGGGICILPVQDIIAVQSDIHIQRVFLRDGRSFAIRIALNALYKKLNAASGGQFINPSKGILVNMLAVSTLFVDHIEVIGGKVFPISPRSYRKLQHQIIEYLENEG